MGRWTRRQAELVCAAVVPEEPGAETVAQSLHPPISKQAVAKALKSLAGFFDVVNDNGNVSKSTAWVTVAAGVFEVGLILGAPVAIA